jgi:hypothetical protein
MVISGVGVQQILPRTGTGWQGANPSPDQNNDSDADGSPSQPSRAPPPSGTGRIVDKIA